jgi:hypothetical protein
MDACVTVDGAALGNGKAVCIGVVRERQRGAVALCGRQCQGPRALTLLRVGERHLLYLEKNILRKWRLQKKVIFFYIPSFSCE